MIRRPIVACALLLVAALVTAACSVSDEVSLGRAAPVPTPSTDTVPGVDREADPVGGAAGVGDPYYPGLGNGGYDVTTYDLEIEWFADDGSIDATALIGLTPTTDLAAFNLDLAGLDVERITVDGRDAAFGREDRELTVTPGQSLRRGDEVVVSVDYSGRPEPIRLGTDVFDLGWHTDGRDAFVASEPAGAATWFPANDHPTDKATFRFEITVPADLSVIANGTRVSRDTVDGRSTWVYESPDLMATYLATVVIGDLVFDESTGPTGLRIRNAYPARIAAEARVDFERTGEMVGVFEDWFGPFPFEVYGVAVVDEVLGFALENQTLSLFGSGLVRGQGAIEGVVAHELAHQWFGDAVSVASWRDIWLSEGFATYGEWIWEQESGGRSISTIAEATHGVADFGVPPGDPGPDELFQPTVYLRGGLALYALSVEIGADAFAELLPAWVARHDDGAASTAQFQALAEEISGEGLGPFFDRWIYGDDLPPLP